MTQRGYQRWFYKMQRKREGNLHHAIDVMCIIVALLLIILPFLMFL